MRRTDSKPARRTSPAPIGLHAAMDYLDAIGRDNIAQHDQELGAYAYENFADSKSAFACSVRTSVAPVS